MEPNFCLPLRRLESEKLRLDVFNPSVHAEAWISEVVACPELVMYFSFGPWTTASKFLDWYQKIESDKTRIWFAIMAKPGNPEGKDRFVGIIGLADVDPGAMSAEIAYVIVFPAFQRTFVLTHAASLLLHYLLDPSPDGLGFWRVQWACQVGNERSCRAAERLGFIAEGVRRWTSVLPQNKLGELVDKDWATTINGTSTQRGRHEKIFAICWDDWEREKRDHVDRLVKRKVT